MHIALIYYRLVHYGGLETRLMNLMEELRRRDHKVTVLCIKYDPSIRLPEQTEVVQLKKELTFKFLRQTAFDRQVGKWMKNHSYDLSISLMRTSHQDYVMCPGNHLGYMKAMGISRPRWRDRVQVREDREAFAGSKLIFAASEMMKRELTEFYHVPESKIRILPPPLDTRRFRPAEPGEKESLRKELGLDPEKRYFVFSGMGHLRKGFSLLTDVFRKLEGTNNHLLFIGGPPPKNPPSNVLYLGFRKDAEKIYRAADALLHPALYEPYGQIVAEAMASGIPAFVSEATGAGQLITPGTGEILPVKNTEAWTRLVQSADFSRYNLSAFSGLKETLAVAHHVDILLDEKSRE